MLSIRSRLQGRQSLKGFLVWPSHSLSAWRLKACDVKLSLPWTLLWADPMTKPPHDQKQPDCRPKGHDTHGGCGPQAGGRYEPGVHCMRSRATGLGP
eukprot:scaffold141699_cov19-Tisochrysis_lutea.AAC.1